MSLLLGVSAIVVIGLLFLWRVRTRPGRARFFEAPHTPPTVPWSSDWSPRGRDESRKD